MVKPAVKEMHEPQRKIGVGAAIADSLRIIRIELIKEPAIRDILKCRQRLAA